MATHVGSDAVTANSVTVSSALPAGLQDNDSGVAVVLYNPSLGALTTTPATSGWTLVNTVIWSTSFHVLVYRKTLTALESSTSITATGATQKLTIAYSVHRGPTAFDDMASFNGSVVQTTQTNPSLATDARDVAVAFWCERESVPSASMTPPAGFTTRDQVFGTGSGATSCVVASNLTEVPSPGPIGGGVWTSNAANDAIVTVVVGLTVPNPFTATPYDGLGLKHHLNRLASTLDGNSRPTLECQAAANAWAGTSKLDLTDALNVKAGTTGLSVVGALNDLAGTTDLDDDAAAASISS
jgi:hypothetical protein